MKIAVKNLPKSQYELTVEVPAEELEKQLDRAVENLSKAVKIEGFRPGKATFEVLKRKIGELSIWEEAARLVIGRQTDGVIKENIKEQMIGRPEISILKLAPGNPLEYKVIVTVLPETTLGAYKDLKIRRERVEVKDEEIERIVTDLREMRAKEALVDREAGEGDKVIVDINMFLDKVPVEGGQGSGTAVIIGKGYVVPGFDKHLIGAIKGEEREFELPYPSDHHQKNLAGKLVQFKVKVREIYGRELPSIDESFLATFGLKSETEFKTNIKESLLKEKEEKARQKAEIVMIDKIIDKARFGELPESLIENEGETMLAELEHNLEHQGAKFEDYLKSIGKSRAELLLELLPDAVKRVKSALIIRQIAELEKIEASEAEVDEEIAKILKHYPGDKKIEERVKSHEYHHYLHNALTNKKIMEKLAGWNIEK